MDNETLVFDTDAKNGWFGTKGVGADGVDAAQSTHLGHSLTNRMGTTVSGPCTFAFTWKVSSEGTETNSSSLLTDLSNVRSAELVVTGTVACLTSPMGRMPWNGDMQRMDSTASAVIVAGSIRLCGHREWVEGLK